MPNADSARAHTPPLHSRKVLVTRPAAQSKELAELLRAAGAEPECLPVIRIVPAADPAPLEEAARAIDVFGWLVFTSPNGVDAFADALVRVGEPGALSGARARVAAIGPGTAASLEARGRRPDVVPDEYVGEAVARAILDAQGGRLDGVRVLLPRAEVARDALPAALAEAGADVRVVTAYRTVGPDAPTAARIRAAIEARAVDAVTFTASSTVRFLVEALGRENAPAALEPLVVASIGPITTHTAEALGLRVDVTAREYTNRGLVDGLASYFGAR